MVHMTRKDFNAIATAFATAASDIRKSDMFKDDGERLDAMLGLEVAMDRVTTVLAASNPNFDHSRFFAAATRIF